MPLHSDQPKIYLDLVKDNYVLHRLDDNKQLTSSIVKFIEWDENDVGKKAHDAPNIGFSCVLDPSGFGNYKWLTSVITEVISINDNEIKFKTLNSTYTLYKI